MASNSKTNTVKNIDNLVLETVLNVVDSTSKGVWTGTMTNLSKSLVKFTALSKQERNSLPKSPSALRVVLNRVVNRLRARSVSVKFGRANDAMRTRFVKLEVR